MATQICVSVVVCCYTMRRRQVLGGAVDAALGQLEPADELIVVVDGDDDERADELYRDLSVTYSDRIMLVRNEFARGLSGARNTGLQAAIGDVVVFLDDDAVLHSGGLDAVRTAFVDPAVTALGGAVHPDWYGGTAPTWFPPEFGWVVGCDYRGLPADGAPIRNPIGAAMAVRRAPLDEIGGFSSALGRVGTVPTGCEETLMGIALAQRDPRARILRNTDFAVSHLVTPDRATVSYFVSRCFHEGRSKAVLTSLCGQRSSLRSERTYTTRTLPSGMWHARADVSRMAAMVAGLIVTTIGYLVGRLDLRRRKDLR
ncbi:glycosyltransferase family 2 protein [Mycobacterium sp. SMC-4]|uniref:glycosyltransferase family 2 protein n=1 Tax=Mycobacterium sp. SMC-4 TaxID=2857059 RepID=UPI003D05F3F5